MRSLTPRFTDAVTLISQDDQGITFEVAGRGRFDVNVASSNLAAAVTALLSGGTSEEELADVAGSDGSDGAVRFYYLLERFRKRGLTADEWRIDGEVQALIEPLFVSHTRAVDICAGDDVILSRFAFSRRDGDRFILESPEASCRVVITSALAAGCLGELALGNIVSPDAVAFRDLLRPLGFLELRDGPESETRATWEFHDRLFHARGRQGLGAASGTLYRFKERFPAARAIKPPMSEERLTLEVPTQESPASAEALLSVLERRRSIRQMDPDAPITREQLTALLYRVARVKEVLQRPEQELMLRPVPSGGAIHELELYVVVGVCAGIERGMYHYHGQEHALYRLPQSDLSVEPFLARAAQSMAQPDEPPQCLIILASRLPRLAWKYEQIAYRITLLNAGVMIQSLYLVATSMNLACSAIGNGDSGLFAAATELDPLEETSVAEFMVGSIDRSRVPV